MQLQLRRRHENEARSLWGRERAARLLSWLERLPEIYGACILDVNAAVAMTAGVMEDSAIAAGSIRGSQTCS
jgi:hypothetical protein